MENRDELEGYFYDEIKKAFSNDFRQRTTTRGPHKDDISFYVNGINMRSFGSQGQQRTCALSLKLAELNLIKEETGEDAVLLLDDVMSELDAGIAASYMELMAEAMGLGVLYSGFFVAASRLGKGLRAELGLESGDKVAACLVVGYPDVSYERTVPRQPLRVIRK